METADNKINANSVNEMIDLIESEDIDVWVDGGWGVDALLGRHTRPHGDLDIVISEEDVLKFRKLLTSKGYKEIKEEIAREWNFVLGDKAVHEVDVHVVNFDNEGNGIYGPPKNNEAYPAEAFSGLGVINGKKIKCISASYQVKSHTGYKLKDKDRKDVIALCEKFGIKAPKEYSSKEE